MSADSHPDAPAGGAATVSAPPDPSPGGSVVRDRRRGRVELLVLAVAAWLPFLLSSPGAISADTKAYLMLDPGRLLGRAGWLWDTHVTAGTITHQNIGYLFPLGPWFWLTEQLGIPTWIAQRVWFGAVFFAAGAGVRWMLRRLGMRGFGPIVGAFAYMFSPYVLAYTGRTSVILLPWAALPWLIGLLHLAIHEHGTRMRWRAPLLLAVVITLMSGTNASSVVFVLIGPALLVPFMVLATREATWRQSFGAVARTAVTTGPAQLWWIAGLWAQGKYGLPILQLTETVETVAQTSSSQEILRGLGYWYTYGRDGLSQWTDAGTLFTQNPGLLAIGWLLPALALLAGVLTRWRYRAYFVLLVVVGMVLGVGTFPYDHPSPIGWVIRTSTETEAGFALRNSPRAVPLLVLGVAGLLACGVESLVSRLRTAATPARRRTAVAVPFVAIALVLLAIPPVWTAQLVQPDMQYPDPLPTYWSDAIAAIDQVGANGGRVLELPGSDFYAYRWGQTQDPITPGLTETPWVGRELTAYGSPASVDLLRALDRRFQEGVGDTAGVAGVARLFAAQAVLLRLETEYERYRAPRPADLWHMFSTTLPVNGLLLKDTFGDQYVPAADPRQPTIDELELARRSGAAVPPLALFSVTDVPPMLRAVSTERPTVLWGDGDGVVDAAETDRLPTTGHALFYAATVTTHADLLASTKQSSPTLVVTDTNRRRAQRWGTLRENNGATEVPGSTALVDDPKDARLDLFPGSDDSSRTTAWYGDDVANVRASSYGNIVAYSAEARPVNAIDGDPSTAWSTGGYSDVIGDRLQIDYTRPITADHIDVRQLRGNRWITKVTVLLDGRAVTTTALGDASFEGAGQTIPLGGARTFTSLTIRIDDANVHGLQSYVGVSNVGFAEVTVPGVRAAEWIRVPSAGLRDLATPTTPLSWILTRWRADALEGFRQDPETRLLRIIDAPNPSRVRVSGTARLTSRVDGARVDELLGRPGLAEGWPIVSGRTWLDGDLWARPSAADDGDLATAWMTPFGRQVGTSITVTNPSATTIAGLKLSVVADGRHSVPTALDLVGDDGVVRTVAVPAIVDGTDEGHVVTVPVTFDPMTTRSLTVRIADEREVTTKEYFGGGQHAFPIAIAELGLSRTVAPLPAEVPSTCRTGVVAIDGVDVPVALAGSTTTAQDRGALDLAPCVAVDLPGGETRIASTAGTVTGIDVDRLVLDTAAPVRGGIGAPDPNPAGPAPTITPERTGELSWKVRVAGAGSPYWLVLGQSWSAGWKATVNGRDLGEPTLIDGIANGWRLDPAEVGADTIVTITWPAQRVVWIAATASAVWFAGVLLALLALALFGWRHRRRSGTRAIALTDSPAATAVDGPRFAWPSTSRIGTGARAMAIVIGIGLGVLIGGPVVGLVLGAVTAIAVWVPRGRWAFALTTVVSLGLVTAIVVMKQWRKRYRPGVEWPSAFPYVHELALLAVLVVAVDTVVRWLATRPTRSAPPDEPPDDAERD